MSDLIVCELKPLTTSTRFGHSVTEASMEIAASKARISVPWEQGVWEFAGSETPIPGTMLVVEVDEEDPSKPPRYVGKVDRFYVAKR
jgi:hypothetical protein